MHTLEHWGVGAANNGARPMEAGGGWDRGGALGSDMGRRKKWRVGHFWWTADGPAQSEH
jgi:hypothetical protein